ncbi:basic amino acid ABC transporter substrate-binding protein [Rhabdobacter roseus]|uniref:ABC-type amino acid transport substrate-binding protein n=1 Tax=Rhabdobacter roseus TaxID=1655419 RepID=A0A840TRP8_9BACT|nr:ABC transporter substrate-binding protein [Rhabdobacter roseus]MBB5286591.1 ABC-type amino acid transport substrate-binding protein [Rhabdobacter roseus]
MENVLKVGLDFAAPIPLHTDISSKKFEGFEVDLMNEIAKELSVALEHKVAYWEDIIADIIHQKIDIICSAATVTEKRKEIVAFSNPYLNFHLALVCNKDNIVALKDLKDKNIGVRISSEAEEYLKKNFPEKELFLFDTNDEQYGRLTEKEIDALIDDTPIAYGFVENNSAIVMAEIIKSTPSQYAIIINKENIDLLNQINSALDKFEKNGYLQDRRDFWFKDTQL